MTQPSDRVWIRRAYEKPTRNDGYRVLIDRLWPRGVSREDLHIDDWMKSIAPSDELRKWFGHDPDRWEGFQRRYNAELDAHDEEVEDLVERARDHRITIVYGAKDVQHNNAVVVAQRIEQRR